MKESGLLVAIDPKYIFIAVGSSSLVSDSSFSNSRSLTSRSSFLVAYEPATIRFLANCIGRLVNALVPSGLSCALVSILAAAMISSLAATSASDHTNGERAAADSPNAVTSSVIIGDE